MERDSFAFAWHLLFSAALISAVRSQIPLPKHPLGFVYQGGESSARAPIHLTAFVDLTCPDSKQAWPTVKKIADMYGPKVVQFTLQLFPLPYHTNAFIAAQVSLRFDLKSCPCLACSKRSLSEHLEQASPCQIIIDAPKNVCVDCQHEFAWQLCTWYISVDETILGEMPSFSEVKPNSAPF